MMVALRYGFRSVIFTAMLLLSLAGCAHRHAQLSLNVAACNTGTALLRLTVNPGTDFSVWFLNSYDRAYFEEHYRVLGGGTILLTHMTFKSSLNGQGFELGTYRARPDGSAELVDINKAMDQIVFRLGSPDLANHTLLINGRRLPLIDYADAGELLCISVQPQ